jgi:PAS domain S-box-containing protein
MDTSAAEQRIRLVAEGTASATGEAFYDALVRALASVCGTRYAMLGALRGPCEVEALALWNSDALEHGLRYSILGTPFESTLADRFFSVEDRIAEEFPEDLLIAEWGIQSYIGVALVSSDGELLGVLSAFHDAPLPHEARDPALLRIFASRATAELERMQMQVAVEESEALTRGIIESSPDGILAVAPSGEIEFLNGAAREMFRLSTESCWDISITQLVPALRLDGAIQPPGPESAPNSSTLELEGLRSDGSRFPIAVTVGRLDLGSRELRTATVRDISQRRIEEQRLRDYAAALEQTNADLERAKRNAEEAARAKTDFLANMSHEIRTPMTAILGFAEILLEEEADLDARPQHREAIRTIRRNGAFLLEILNDVLDFSKIEANRLEVERIPCSPLEILFDVETLMRVRAEQKEIEFGIALEGAIPQRIETDPVRLRQVLLNLVGNAVKFTDQGGVQISVRYQQALQLIEFEISDTGLGIPLEQLVHIFDPFSQADTSTTRRFGGTGLGLPISKRLTELLGGRIEAHSIVERGSIFRVSLPVGAVEAVEMVDEIEEPDTDSDHNLLEQIEQARLRGRILVVEDGCDNQRLIRHILERAGCEVEVAENGQVGVDLALEASNGDEPFDAILMDVQMPVLDGYEATRRLREQGYTEPIIALTAHAFPAERQRCMAAGCDDFATKPIDRFKLLSMLGATLKKRRG